MGRTLVGGRSLVASVGRLGQLGFGAGQTIGQLGHLAGELENDAVLLLHVALQEGQTFFEVVKPGIHGSEDAGGRRRGKPMPRLYDKYDTEGLGHGFGGGQPAFL